MLITVFVHLVSFSHAFDSNWSISLNSSLSTNSYESLSSDSYDITNNTDQKLSGTFRDTLIPRYNTSQRDHLIDDKKNGSEKVDKPTTPLSAPRIPILNVLSLGIPIQDDSQNEEENEQEYDASTSKEYHTVLSSPRQFILDYTNQFQSSTTSPKKQHDSTKSHDPTVNHLRILSYPTLKNKKYVETDVGVTDYPVPQIADQKTSSLTRHREAIKLACGSFNETW